MSGEVRGVVRNRRPRPLAYPIPAEKEMGRMIHRRWNGSPPGRRVERADAPAGAGGSIRPNGSDLQSLVVTAVRGTRIDEHVASRFALATLKPRPHLHYLLS